MTSAHSLNPSVSRRSTGAAASTARRAPAERTMRAPPLQREHGASRGDVTAPRLADWPMPRHLVRCVTGARGRRREEPEPRGGQRGACGHAACAATSNHRGIPCAMWLRDTAAAWASDQQDARAVLYDPSTTISKTLDTGTQKSFHAPFHDSTATTLATAW